MKQSMLFWISLVSKEFQEREYYYLIKDLPFHANIMDPLGSAWDFLK